MISEVVMPQMGADMVEGTLVRWIKNEGDDVTRGEIIAEIETDKANVEIEAFEGGVFRKALAAEGDVVPVGGLIGIIAGADDDISQYANGTSATATNAAPAAEKTQQPAQAASQTPPPATEREQQAATSTPYAERPQVPAPPAETHAPGRTDGHRADTGQRLRISPVARRIADERGIDIHTLRGSGPDGRIVKRDVDAAVAGKPAAPSAEPAPSPQPATRRDEPVAVEMSKMRQAIARSMSKSKREAPHYYLLVDIDMTEAVAFRSQVNAAIPEDAKVSINDLVVRACALALQKHPDFNATFAGEDVMQHSSQNVCIAIALDEGLIAPAIIDAGVKSLTQIAADAKDLVERAKGGRLRQDELTDGTFTITNLGAYGVETLIGIIQPPQTAILGVGSLMDQPVAADGSVTVRKLMKVALSADHRVTDGAQGARFLTEIKGMLERPLLLVL